ncbi:MAG: CPBP family intramembrane glutamic endopeptidase [Streptosporangiaceae bacterium]
MEPPHNGWASPDPGPPADPDPALPQYGQNPAPPDGRPPSPAYGQPSSWQQPQQPYPSYGQQPYPSYGPGYAGPGQVAPMPPYGQPWWYPQAKGPRTVAAVAGTPFHQLGHTALHRWWRPLLGTGFLAVVGVVLTIGVYVVWLLGHWLVTGQFAEPSGDDRLFPGSTEDLAAQLAMLAIFTPVVLLTVWLVQRRPVGSVVSVLNRVRWRWLLACFGAALGFVVISYGLSVVVGLAFTDEGAGIEWIGWRDFLAPALVILLLVPLQSTAEEFMFRGWLLQAIGSYTGTRFLGPVLRSPWPAMVISSAVFVAGHGYTGWAMLDIFLWAMTAAWLVVRTGGLEAGIALHVCNNLMAFLLPAAAGELGDTLEQGGAPWYVLLADLPPLVFFAAMILLAAKRMNVARLTY